LKLPIDNPPTSQTNRKMIRTFITWIISLLYSLLLRGKEVNIINVPVAEHEHEPETEPTPNIKECFTTGKRYIFNHRLMKNANAGGVPIKNICNYSRELINPWRYCQYEENGEWMSITRLHQRVKKQARKIAPVLSDTGTQVTQPPSIKGCSVMAKCFIDGQRIRHKIDTNKNWTDIWTATYDRSQNALVHNGNSYVSPKCFVKAHYEIKVDPHNKK
jgi:hypothetical protein